jgi:hypothetical protein
MCDDHRTTYSSTCLPAVAEPCKCNASCAIGNNSRYPHSLEFDCFDGKSIVLIILSFLYISHAAVTANLAPVGVICETILENFNNGGTLQTSSLFLSDQERNSNVPFIVNQGDNTLMATTSKGALGLIAELGYVQLETLGAGVVTSDLIWAQSLMVYPGVTYLVSSVKPGSNAGLMAFIPTQVLANGTLVLQFGVFYHSVHSRTSGDTSRVELGGALTTLFTPQYPDFECEWITYSASCLQEK